MPDIVTEVSQAIIDELNVAASLILSTYKLGNTELIDSIEWRYQDNLWVLWANDYFKYLNDGRRRSAKKIPVVALIKWIKKKNIQPRGRHTVNSVAYAIQNSIFKVGVQPRRFADPIIRVSLDILSDYIAEDISVQIVNQLAADLTIIIGNTN